MTPSFSPGFEMTRTACALCVGQEKPCDRATANQPGSPNLEGYPLLPAGHPKTVLLLFGSRAKPSRRSLSEARSQQEAQTLSSVTRGDMTWPLREPPAEWKTNAFQSTAEAGPGPRRAWGTRPAACCACGFAHTGCELAAPRTCAGHRQPRPRAAPSPRSGLSLACDSTARLTFPDTWSPCDLRKEGVTGDSTRFVRHVDSVLARAAGRL